MWALLHFIMPTLFDSHEEFNEWFSKDIENHAENKSAIDQGISQISTECSYASECTTDSIIIVISDLLLTFLDFLFSFNLLRLICCKKYSQFPFSNFSVLTICLGWPVVKGSHNILFQMSLFLPSVSVDLLFRLFTRSFSTFSVLSICFLDQLSRLHMILKPFMLRRIKRDVENELSEKVNELFWTCMAE